MGLLPLGHSTFIKSQKSGPVLRCTSLAGCFQSVPDECLEVCRADADRIQLFVTCWGKDGGEKAPAVVARTQELKDALFNSNQFYYFS